MPTLRLTAITLALSLNLSFAQQPNANPSSAAKESAPQRVTVYSVGPGVSAPEIVPSGLPPIIPQKCKKKLNGTVSLTLLIDTAGRTRNIMFIRPLGNDLDQLALKLVSFEEFTPATREGVPVVVAESAELEMKGCVQEEEDSSGAKHFTLRLRENPVRKYQSVTQPQYNAVLTDNETAWPAQAPGAPGTVRIGGVVHAPIPLTTPEAHYTPEARKAMINGKCLISVIVDRQGMPQSPTIVKSLDPGLDQNAMLAVRQYRFKPAMKDGEPVPVIITVEVNFQL